MAYLAVTGEKSEREEHTTEVGAPPKSGGRSSAAGQILRLAAGLDLGPVRLLPPEEPHVGFVPLLELVLDAARVRRTPTVGQGADGAARGGGALELVDILADAGDLRGLSLDLRHQICGQATSLFETVLDLAEPLVHRGERRR